MRAAEDLLVEGGVRAASPAAVAGRAGAGKMSIYRHFSGKNELLAAALAEREGRHRAWLVGAGDMCEPVEAVLQVFDRVARAARTRSFAGCPYVNARIEARDRAHPIADVVCEHKRLVVEELSERLERAGISSAGQLARTLVLLLDGATVHAVLAGSDAPLRDARAAAESLIGLAAVDAGRVRER
jgi:AcrR family transcriptional regulator